MDESLCLSVCRTHMYSYTYKYYTSASGGFPKTSRPETDGGCVSMMHFKHVFKVNCSIKVMKMAECDKTYAVTLLKVVL